MRKKILNSRLFNNGNSLVATQLSMKPAVVLAPLSGNPSPFQVQRQAWIRRAGIQTPCRCDLLGLQRFRPHRRGILLAATNPGWHRWRPTAPFCGADRELSVRLAISTTRSGHSGGKPRRSPLLRARQLSRRTRLAPGLRTDPSGKWNPVELSNAFRGRSSSRTAIQSSAPGVWFRRPVSPPAPHQGWLFRPRRTGRR